MRQETGAPVRVFNGHDGEWLGVLEEVSKKNVIARVLHQTVEQKSCPDIVVLASPVKKDCFDIMLEKAGELGAAAFTPVMCERTVIGRVNTDRLRLIATEAAEQSERLEVMTVFDPVSLKDLLKSWDKNRKLVFCIERSDAQNIMNVLPALRGQPLALLTGPEGGFSPAETELIMSCNFVVPVSLGPRILRAETAMIAALSCLQAGCGDW